MDGFLNKVLEIISKSDRIGFALVFAGAAIFLGWYYQVEPFTYLTKEQLGFILFGSLAGAGLLIFRLAVLIWWAISTCTRSIHGWHVRRKTLRTAPNRLSELLPLELHSLVWLLANKKLTVPGSRIQEPFNGLLRKGFLIPTDGREYNQMMRINPAVLAVSQSILDQIPKHFQQELEDDTPPWQRRI